MIEFQPHSPYLRNYITKTLENDKRLKYLKLFQKLTRYKFPISKLIHKRINELETRLDYSLYVDFIINNYNIKNEQKQFSGITPMWDNTARRGENAFLFFNYSPEKYADWLNFILSKKENTSGEDYIFINAWNEWAEGNHLEPCIKYGHSYLQATKSELDKYNGNLI